MKQKKQRKLPIIGISATLLSIDSGSFIGREQAVVLNDYIESIRLAGAIPIVLPIVQEEEVIHEQMALVDGLLLSGGYDISPLFYKEEPQINLGAFRSDRDKYEIQLVEIARQSRKPILGICRGNQLLNVAFGGTLYQDISTSVSSKLQHSQKAKPDEATHSVHLVRNTQLQSILQEMVVLTNSFHHQAIKDVAPGFIVNAHSVDGIIEGIEWDGELFILGIQWHPELMFLKHPRMFNLFHAFVEATQKNIK